METLLVQMKATVMALDDGAGNTEAQACAMACFGGEKGIHNTLTNLDRNPMTTVGHGDCHSFFISFHIHPYPSVGSILQGIVTIVEQVQKDLRNLHGAAFQSQVR